MNDNTDQKSEVSTPISPMQIMPPQNQEVIPVERHPAPLPAAQARALFGGVVTSQEVAVPRSHAKIMAEIKDLAFSAGRNYLYSWEAKRASGARETIEGGSIKMANDLLRIYGNSEVDIRAIDEGEWITFYARFIDWEKGNAMVRPFRQRKNQDTGMKDKDREADIVFQIGASKAIRNVVLNYLQTYADYALQCAKDVVIQRIEGNVDGARDYLLQTFEAMGIEVDRVTRQVGRAPDKWRAQEMAKLYAQLQSIEDGMAHPEDLWPSKEGVTEQGAGTSASKLDTFAERQAPAEEPKPDAKKKAEPKKRGRPKGSTKKKAKKDEETPSETASESAPDVSPSAADVPAEAASGDNAGSGADTEEASRARESAREGDQTQETSAEAEPPVEPNADAGEPATAETPSDLGGQASEQEQAAAGDEAGPTQTEAPAASDLRMEQREDEVPGQHLNRICDAINKLSSFEEIRAFQDQNADIIASFGGPGDMMYDLINNSLKGKKMQYPEKK